jgi:ribonuclease VapC
MPKRSESLVTISVVLDSSAMLAALQDEPGAELVAPVLPTASILSVNFAEVVTKLIAGGGDPATVRRDLGTVSIKIVDFDKELAQATGELVLLTKSKGLSLGDRACLALARREKLPVLTTDRAWQDLDVGVKINVIR